MGLSGSSTVAKPLASLNTLVYDTSALDWYEIPFDNFADPKFWSEFYISQLTPDSEKSMVKRNALSISPGVVNHLFFGCFEHLDDVQKFLNIMIHAGVYPDSQNDPLEQLFQKYVLYGQCREICYSINWSFRNAKLKNVFDFGNIPTPSLSASEIFEGVQLLPKLYNSNFIQNIKSKQGSKYIEYFESILPMRSLTPPHPNFHKEQFTQLGSIKLYASCFPGTLTSNGEFLFFISGSRIYIFSLSNSSALHIPHTIMIDDLVTRSIDQISCFASKEHLYIQKYRSVYRMPIKTLIYRSNVNLAMFQSVRSSGYNDFIYTSDGVTCVEISDNGLINLANVETLETYNALLCINNEDIRFGQNVYFTNGAFLGVIAPPLTEGGNAILNTYSMITGKLLGSEKFDVFPNFVDVCVDTINRCLWCTHKVDKNSNDVILRRVNFLGAVNPILLGFTHRPPSSKMDVIVKNPFKTLTGTMNEIFIHLIGSQIMPKTLESITSMKALRIIIDVSREFVTSHGKNHGKILFQILTTLADLYINFSMNVLPPEIFDLFEYLPEKDTLFLLCNHFEQLCSYGFDKSLHYLISSLKSVTDCKLLAYCYHQLESTNILAYINFNGENEISKLIPQTLEPIEKITPQVMNLMFIHQRVLISVASRFIRQNPFVNIEFHKKEDSNALDYLCDYAQNLTNKFDMALTGGYTIELLH